MNDEQRVFNVRSDIPIPDTKEFPGRKDGPMTRYPRLVQLEVGESMEIPTFDTKVIRWSVNGYANRQGDGRKYTIRQTDKDNGISTIWRLK